MTDHCHSETEIAEYKGLFAEQLECQTVGTWTNA